MQTDYNIPISELNKDRGYDLPTNIIGKLSEYENAQNCFVMQQFSHRLQVYLVNYVFNISSHFDQNG